MAFCPFSTTLSDTPPVEKKYKPLNTTPNSAKEIKVKLIPPQREFCSFSILSHNDYDNKHKCNLYVFAKYLFFYSLAMEASGFLDALNSAPVPGIKIKKKKTKAVSPTSNKVCYSDGFMCLSMLVSPLNTHSLTIFYLSCSSPVRSTAGHSHTRAHRPNPLPPSLPHLTPLLMRTKTWSSPAHRCPPKTLKQWTPVSHVTQNSAKNFC